MTGNNDEGEVRPAQRNPLIARVLIWFLIIGSLAYLCHRLLRAVSSDNPVTWVGIIAAVGFAMWRIRRRNEPTR